MRPPADNQRTSCSESVGVSQGVAKRRKGRQPPYLLLLPLPPAAPFLSAAKEREERTPPKPRFWNPSAAKVPTALVSFCPANRNKKFRALLSYGLCAYIRWPLTRTRAGLVGRGQIERLSYSTRRYFLPRVRRGRPPGRPEPDLRRISSYVSLRGRSAPLAIRNPRPHVGADASVRPTHCTRIDYFSLSALLKTV